MEVFWLFSKAIFRLLIFGWAGAVLPIRKRPRRFPPKGKSRDHARVVPTYERLQLTRGGISLFG